RTPYHFAAFCSLIISVAGGKAAQDFADTGKETYSPEDYREPWLRVQTEVEEIADGGGDGDGADQSEWQFEGECRPGDIAGHPYANRCRGLFFRFIVRRHIERAA